LSLSSIAKERRLTEVDRVRNRGGTEVGHLGEPDSQEEEDEEEVSEEDSTRKNRRRKSKKESDEPSSESGEDPREEVESPGQDRSL